MVVVVLLLLLLLLLLGGAEVDWWRGAGSASVSLSCRARNEGGREGGRGAELPKLIHYQHPQWQGAIFWGL